ncbi:hypothetical protein [Fibrisoma limi]|nr:hypothetical protein [Fibrisoma limi]
MNRIPGLMPLLLALLLGNAPLVAQKNPDQKAAYYYMLRTMVAQLQGGHTAVITPEVLSQKSKPTKL